MAKTTKKAAKPAKKKAAPAPKAKKPAAKKVAKKEVKEVKKAAPVAKKAAPAPAKKEVAPKKPTMKKAEPDATKKVFANQLPRRSKNWGTIPENYSGRPRHYLHFGFFGYQYYSYCYWVGSNYFFLTAIISGNLCGYHICNYRFLHLVHYLVN